MISVLFACIALEWGLLAAYFAYRFATRRKPQSVIIALACLGWPVAVARELGWLRRLYTTPLIAFAFVAGLVGVLIVWHWESQHDLGRRVRRFFRRTSLR